MPDGLTQTAKEMLELSKKIEELNKPLDEKKEIFRNLANGETKEVVVEGMGKVSISKPRVASEKTILQIVDDKIENNQELKKLMLSKGIIKEVTQRTAAAKASITIKPNI